MIDEAAYRRYERCVEQLRRHGTVHATTGAWPGYQPFGGWKGSGSTGKAIGSFWYLPQYLREQARTVVE